MICRVQRRRKGAREVEGESLNVREVRNRISIASRESLHCILYSKRSDCLVRELVNANLDEHICIYRVSIVCNGFQHVMFIKFIIC